MRLRGWSELLPSGWSAPLSGIDLSAQRFWRPSRTSLFSWANWPRSDDLPRYVRDGFPSLTPMTVVDGWVAEIEAQNVSFKGWATPGATVNSAALDVARTVCRRAERRVCALDESAQLQNPEIVIYLKPLADLLWLFAWAEKGEMADQS